MNLEGNDFVHVLLDSNDHNNRLVDLNLYCGYNIIYHQLLEGGGIDQRRDFLYAISKAGKPVYENTLEWCSGPGVIGYELLGFNKTKHISFMDFYEPAINSCIENAKRNNVQDKVTVYLTDKIANINESKKFDLVVANPPHSFDFHAWKHSKLVEKSDPNQEIANFEDLKRIDVDHNMEIHKEFFDNIRDKITDDADIFISEVGDRNVVINYALAKGYEMIACWYMRSMGKSSGEILHMRPKKTGFII
jgi:methylase of polypeptide subunit release factors